ncbi:hypothetical protein PN462_10435 [Spirulina sp. CS-785/01]|uniref:hypothetical protein n=1 Tax=Spirulina sp. CS-785/01 TaxID=3021716 RepID=UPI00232CF37D|nr:hypothetical protein [Spirulina sp. CS-785/01]MDB9313516.1 hypothetical protein [Spirulina sp. CS-785/01]
MQTPKAQKIDLTQEYPCPCRRKGTLKPIMLTDAFGCDRCQQIFVVSDNRQSIEQLSTVYPYKRAWRWTGHRWVLLQSRFSESYFPVFSTLVMLVLIGVLLAVRSPTGFTLLLFVILVILLVIIPAVLFWLSYRR